MIAFQNIESGKFLRCFEPLEECRLLMDAKVFDDFEEPRAREKHPGLKEYRTVIYSGRKDGPKIEEHPMLRPQRDMIEILKRIATSLSGLAEERRKGIESMGHRNNKPEFFPMPTKGVDPWFGIGRGSYYNFEKLGMIRLTRIRKPGCIRAGPVIISYAAVQRMIEKIEEDEKRGK